MPARNARIGLVLFAVYLVLYGGFVFLNAFSPRAMEAKPLFGVNLAILYGFGLIVAALVLALAYGFLCRSDALPEGDRSENGTGTDRPDRSQGRHENGTGTDRPDRSQSHFRGGGEGGR
ncbi:MAG: DUF485 domain-containing protein [Planctomycetes bacterium]|nr:DUF485 domain-containing protein [Planctomycetota bacterium]